MTIPRSLAEILQKHVTLEVEGIDRMYLNVYVPRLQIAEGALGFIRRHRGYPVASTRMVEPITREFVAAIEKFVGDHSLPLVSFDKGQRKEDVAARFRAGFSKPEGVVFIGKAQEKCTVYRTEKRRIPHTGRTYGHEYVKRQLKQRGITYQALDNGILSCQESKCLQALCDGLSAAKIETCYGSGSASYLTPFPPAIAKPDTVMTFPSCRSNSPSPRFWTDASRAESSSKR
jgi:hypothetical protein